ncbi:hypothetical protein BGX38DRAFT_581544 [Terfezia claveryi]|nr:hypothetical protein BGX38DRAFT_581544 [Terfezia claveryi]
MNMRTRAQTRFNRGNTPLPAPLAQARPAGPPTAKPRPDATSAPKCRTTTRSARKRKAQADKIPPLIIEYLNSVHPTQWSFDDAKAYMKVEGLGTKIKWELKAKLEEIVNSSNDGERCQAAIRVLQKLNSHRVGMIFFSGWLLLLRNIARICSRANGSCLLTFSKLQLQVPIAGLTSRC